METIRPAWAVKAIFVIVFTSALFRCVCGVNITVGGASGWDVRSNVQAWASTTTFNVGDDLVFSYTPVNDVVEVNQQGYATCTIANAIGTYDTGETVIPLTGPGTRYFVCGRLGHCQQGLKIEVPVQAQPNNNATNANNNNGTSADPNRRGGRRSPPRRSPPMIRPPPRLSPPRRSPPSPGAFPPAPGPCNCSSAEESHHVLLMVPLITIVITLILLSSPPIRI
ncbi:blue copper protein-like [Lotus japonicus]|uniref:blue copper protein-like n=1 Tax=Lotus japonicus TaxID=34305 RepID=UPI0025871B8F|nr:blue copper protein-like [Lotus japonicus]XP_057443456.1 blue copper protein-like [Lotus japonicus]